MLQDYMTHNSEGLPILRTLGRCMGMDVESATIDIDYHKISPDMRDTVRKYISFIAEYNHADRTSAILNTHTIAKLLLGPILFKPTYEQCFCAEDLRITIPCKDFVSPYPLFAIDFPKEYSEFSFGVFHRIHDFVVVIIGLSDNKTLLVGRNNFARYADEEVEEWIADQSHVNCKLVQDELLLLRKGTRILLNYCLMLDEFGSKKQGPVSQSWYDSLARKRHLPEARDAIVSVPILHAINQTVELRNIERRARESIASGYSVMPHRRRAHWRMQRHGPGLSLSKRIRIDSVIVHKNLLPEGSSATYTTKGDER